MDIWHITLKCIYIFAVTFSKMEKLVKFLILFLQIRASIVELADKQQAMNFRWGQMAIFWLFEVGMKYVWPGTYRRQSSSSPASNTQPNQGAGLHKFEATVGKVKNKMLPNPPLYGYQNDRL